MGILAITLQPLLVFTSNAFAILGQCAMHILLADLIYRCIYLKLGLALVLVGRREDVAAGAL